MLLLMMMLFLFKFVSIHTGLRYVSCCLRAETIYSSKGMTTFFTKQTMLATSKYSYLHLEINTVKAAKCKVMVNVISAYYYHFSKVPFTKVYHRKTIDFCDHNAWSQSDHFKRRSLL